MTGRRGLEAAARNVIDTNKYMLLGTADAHGRPWVTPVYFTPHGYADFYWVSSPDALHSRSITQRPEVSVVVFDSQVPIGAAEAVYMTATDGQVPDDDLDRCADIFRSRLSEVRDFAAERMRPPEPLRLYRATVTEHSILIRGGDAQHGREVDSRLALSLSDEPCCKIAARVTCCNRKVAINCIATFRLQYGRTDHERTGPDRAHRRAAAPARAGVGGAHHR